MEAASSRCEKASYRSKTIADEAISKIRNDPNRTIQVPRYSYECPDCGLWHLSSKPNKRHLTAVLDALGLDEE